MSDNTFSLFSDQCLTPFATFRRASKSIVGFCNLVWCVVIWLKGWGVEGLKCWGFDGLRVWGFDGLRSWNNVTWSISSIYSIWPFLSAEMANRRCTILRNKSKKTIFKLVGHWKLMWQWVYHWYLAQTRGSLQLQFCPHNLISTHLTLSKYYSKTRNKIATCDSINWPSSNSAVWHDASSNNCRTIMQKRKDPEFAKAPVRRVRFDNT